MNSQKDRSHLFRQYPKVVHSQETISGLKSARNKCVGRGYHTSLLVRDHIFTFGGDCDVDQSDISSIAIYDVKNDKWEYVKTDLPTRYGHTACAFDQNKIIIYGGQSCDELMEDKPINTLIIAVEMNENNQEVRLEWRNLENDPGEYLQRYCHTAHVIQEQMYILGGLDRAGHSTNSVWCFNLHDFLWIECPTINNPLDERWGHSSIISQHLIYLFGGYSDLKRAYMNDFWILNLENMVWQQNQVVSNIFPSPRRGHSMVLENNKIYCFGGEIEDGVYSEELFNYNIGFGQWENLPVNDLSMEPRGWHTMMIYDENILIFGGRSQKGYLSDFQLIPMDGVVKEIQRFEEHKIQDRERLSMREEIILLNAGVNLENIDMNSCKALVYFFEGKGLNLTLVQPLELLKLSYQFNLVDLRKTCEAFLMKNLTVYNYVEVALAADVFQVVDLKKAVLDFVVKNISKIQSMDDLQKLPKEWLITILMRYADT